MNEKSETSVTNLMELMLDEDWVLEAVGLEDEADCSIAAGLNWGIHLGAFVAHPAAWSPLVRLRALVMQGFRELLAEWDLGAGMEAAYECGEQLLLERLQQPEPAVQAQLVALLEDVELGEREDNDSPSLELGVALRDLLLAEDWEAIAAAAARGVRERVMAASAVG